MTDTEYTLAQLQAHPNGRDAMQIISASLREREVGLTVHSRVADLRAQGYTISCAIEGKTRKGRERYVYRLVGVRKPPTSVEQQPQPGGLVIGSSGAAAVLDVNPDQLVLA